ncbi:MAG: hypothetical protein J5772_08065 [Clostridia bacterium]|nr:hypothetical protein [Clostridia bacterium]
MMRRLFYALIILCFVLVIAICGFVFYYYPAKLRPKNDYRDASALLQSGEYVSAALKFESLGDYSDSAERAKNAWRAAADESFDAGDFAKARTYYLKAGQDASVVEKLDAAYYQMGVKYYAENERVEGENCFSCISSGSRYLALLDPVRISCGERFLEEDDLESAEKVFSLCGEASRDDIADIWLKKGSDLLLTGDTDGAGDCFAKAMAYTSDRDAMTRVTDNRWYAAGIAAGMAGDEELAEKCFARMSYSQH